jgi:hypothetical protein
MSFFVGLRLGRLNFETDIELRLAVDPGNDRGVGSHHYRRVWR